MKVLVALSGGVDSSVAALKLKEKGYDLIGVTIKTWPKGDCGKTGDKLCCSLESIQIARSVAEDLDIPYYVIDLSKEFEKHIIDYFISEYMKGRTPNPCIYCNSVIKFGYLYKKAIELGADKIASGHFARISSVGNEFILSEPTDLEYDQTYFLADIKKSMLANVLFPLGEISKEQVRVIAAKNNFLTAERKSSQDICFATGKGGYKQYLSDKGVNVFIPGDILDIEGKILGTHQGITSYTIGQRRGLGVAGPEPYYVIKLDSKNNTVTVGTRAHSMKKKVKVVGINWLKKNPTGGTNLLKTRIRYNGYKISSHIEIYETNEALVTFMEEQFAPTPGQAAVFYNGPIVVGGGWIEEVIE